jgi:LmbE family N-acetylglucosaminyl deacetylase
MHKGRSGMNQKKVIVFALHPDDETLGCGGTIVKEVQKGRKVYVVLMTDGRHSHDLVLGLREPPPEKIARIRAKEFGEDTKILGIPSANLIHLRFEDSKLTQHTQEAKEKTLRILCEIEPVEIYVPYRNDGSEDHCATYEIVKESILEAKLHVTVFEYPMWNRETPTGLKVHSTNIRDQLKRKLEAISKYKSQTSKCFPNQKEPVLNEDFVKISTSDTETFYAEA